MRILHISTRLILGGSQENTILSCEGQAQRGHEVHLAFGPIYGPEGSLLQRALSFRTSDGRPITTHTIPHLIREVRPRADLAAQREIRALIQTIKPDIVHTHSSKAGIVGRAAAWQSTPRPAILHTIHGPPFMPIEGGPIARLRTRISNAIYTRAERFAARRCHAIISVADAMTRQFLARSIGISSQYTTIYSGMEVDRYLHASPGESRADMRTALGLADTDIVIGTVARLAEHKGHDDLLSALADDLRSNPHLKLLWIGDGWWRNRLIDKACAAGVTTLELDKDPSSLRLSISSSPPPQLLLTGLIPPERIPAHLRAMDILAHPSYREGLPRTIPQALLCGVVPVAYDVDGTGEVCRDMETGRLIPAGNLTQLRAAILSLAQSPETRRTLAARGREWCADRFSAPRMVDDLEHAYTKSLALARKGPP